MTCPASFAGLVRWLVVVSVVTSGFTESTAHEQHSDFSLRTPCSLWLNVFRVSCLFWSFSQFWPRRLRLAPQFFEVVVIADGRLHDVYQHLSLIHISEPTRLGMISYAV